MSGGPLNFEDSFIVGREIIVQPLHEGPRARIFPRMKVSGDSAPLLLLDDVFVRGDQVTRGSMLKDLISQKADVTLMPLIAEKEILFSQAKDVLLKYIQKEIAQEICLETLKHRHAEYAALFNSKFFPKLMGISFNRFMRLVARNANARVLAVGYNHQEALELLISFGLSLSQSSKDSNLFWDAVNDGFFELAKFIFRTLGAGIFKGPDFWMAFKKALAIAIETLEEREGAIEFFRDWLLEDDNLGRYLPKYSKDLITYRALFLQFLIENKCWEFIDAAFMQKAYQGFDLWDVRDGHLKGVFLNLSKTSFEAWELHDSDLSESDLSEADLSEADSRRRDSEGLEISCLTYCLKQNLHALAFYLLAFDFEVSEGFNYARLFNKDEESVTKKRRSTFATLLSVQEVLLSQENLEHLGMTNLSMIREAVLESAINHRDWSALNRLLMTVGQFNRSGFEETLTILETCRVLKDKLIKKIQEPVRMKISTAAGAPDIFTDVSLLKFSVLKSYVGLLLLVLNLGKLGFIDLDPKMLEIAFKQDSKETRAERLKGVKRPLVFSCIFNLDSSLKLYVGSLLAALSSPPAASPARSVSDASSISASVSPEGDPAEVTVIRRESALPEIGKPEIGRPRASLVVQPVVQALLQQSAASGGAGRAAELAFPPL